MTDHNEQSPFTRPWFITAAVVIALVVVAGVILAALNLARGDDPPSPDPSSSTGAAPSASPTADEGGESVCGLEGVELTGTVTTSPETEWLYQDVYAYPFSKTAGPGDTAAEGYRYCFQHTPEGALFAAGNMTIQSFGPADARLDFLEYALSNGTYRSQLLSDVGADGAADVRVAVAGFRMLAYEGDRARVDIAFRGSAQGESVSGSVVFELVWTDGDWKLDADTPEPARIAQLPDLSGYTNWSAS